MLVKKVLIAHQSTIPYYRIPFYQAVERLRPKWWEFAVIYDKDETLRNFFWDSSSKPVDFKVKETYTFRFQITDKQIVFQTFPFKAWNYDLLIVGSELRNISYPFSYLWRFWGKSIAYWGHGRDFSVEVPVGLKGITEKTKVWLTDHADGFFAYTKRVSDYMIDKGVDKKKIFTLYNTIDIEEQRSVFNQLYSQRSVLRNEKGLNNKKVLLYVGRMNKRKNLDFLLNAFVFLRNVDPSYHMIVVGGGDTSFISSLKEKCEACSFNYYGVINDKYEIGKIYTISDIYIFPGDIGLGPLQALCYDLTPVVIDSSTHGPEYEYINNNNSLILPKGTNFKEYSNSINNFFTDSKNRDKMRSQSWNSIRHLTVENMAKNFVNGVSSILSSSEYSAVKM